MKKNEFGREWKAAQGGVLNSCARGAFAAAVAVALGAATAWAGFTATGTLGGGDEGKTLQDGTVYFVQSNATISRVGTTSSALYVANNATSVVYIPKGMTLNVHGGNADGTTSAGAGIRLDNGSTLVVTGGGTLNVRGGNAANGGNGGNGGAGHQYYDDGTPGKGGKGGIGGGGAAAAIGGIGGDGGAAGLQQSSPENLPTTWYEYDREGAGGDNGGGGGAASSSGNIYFLGTVSVTAQGGTGGSGGSQGSAGSGDYEDYSRSWRVGGGGGGGGGAGGNGGSYETTPSAYTYYMPNGGNGGGGSNNGGGSRSEGQYTSYTGNDSAGKRGGHGGYGGAVGSNGSSGAVYKDSGVTVSGSSPSASSATTHPAIEYTLRFSDGQRVDTNVTAKLGYALPAAPMPPSRPGWEFHGWFDRGNGGGTKYYDANGGAVLQEYAVAGDVTLHAHWTMVDPSSAGSISINGTVLVGGVPSSGDGWSYDGATGLVTLSAAGMRYVVSGRDSTGEFGLLPTAACTVVMSNLTIDASANNLRPPFEARSGANPTLLFEGTNTLRGPRNHPAIYIGASGSLTIGDCGGKVTATGGENAPGIGGAVGTTSGTLEIRGGDIEARGGKNGSGIGAAAGSGFGTVTISGGTVKAYGQEGAAGLGGSQGAGMGNYVVSGGTVSAWGGLGGPGIGSGQNAIGGTVSISGGTVSATGGDNGAGIGGGQSSTSFSVTVSGGRVTANGGSRGAGIGGGKEASFSSVTVSGGTVSAAGGNQGAGIGGGYGGTGGTVKISGGTVTATGGGNYGAGIGAGDAANRDFASGISIAISGGVVTASSSGAAGIGAGDYASCGAISISGGTVHANTGASGARPIGKSNSSSAASVTITGGAVYPGKNEIDPAPKNASSAAVFPVDFQIGEPTNRVTSLTFSASLSGYSYGTTDLYTDNTGKLRVYLPSTGGAAFIAKVVMAGGGSYYFSFGIDDGGNVVYCGYLVVNGTLVSSDADHSGNGWNYVKSTGILTLTADAEVQGFSTNGDFRLVVPASSSTANLTLKNLELGDGDTKAKNASMVVIERDVALILSGSNAVFAAGQYSAGIEVASNATLTVSGSGSLRASGGQCGAGIGSHGGYETPGKILIQSGTIDARGGDRAAGIGGGMSSTLDKEDNIIIEGGIVTATGGAYAPGIGAGYFPNSALPIAAGAVRIAGGTVLASRNGDSGGYDLVRSNSTVSPSQNEWTFAILGGSVVPDNGADAVAPRPCLPGADATNELYAIEFTGLDAGAETSIAGFVGDIPDYYSLSGIYADAGGRICLWLPATNRSRIIQVNGKYYQTPYPYTNSTLPSYYRVDVVLDGASGSDTPPEEILVDGKTNYVVTLPGFAPGTSVAIAGLESEGVASAMAVDAEGEGFFYLPDGEYAFTANGYAAAVTVAGAPATVHYILGVTVNGTDVGDISGDGWSFGLSDAQLELSGAGPFALSGTNADGKVSVLASAACAVTFDSLSLDTVSATGRPPFEVAPGATVTLTLSGTNTLHAPTNCAAIQVPATAALVVNGEGALTAKGGYHAAGIGGGRSMAVGIIRIAGGQLTAEGGTAGAGIGGGRFGSGGSVAVSGGNVTATGGNDAGAGIGSGNSGTNFTVAISGGTIKATGGNSGAGIGGGGNSRTNAVAITGGEITAEGGEYAAGIGSGDQAIARTSTGDTVSISGGFVRVAAGGNSAAAVGSSDYGSCGTIAISGGTVWERGGNNLRVGGSAKGNGPAKSVTLTGGSVRASSDAISPAASNGTARVWRVVVGGFTPNVRTPAISGLPPYYVAADLVADYYGRVYLWLPNGTYCFVAGDRPMRVTVSGADTAADVWSAGVTVNGTDVAFLSGDGWEFAGRTVTLSGATDCVVSGSATNVRVNVAADAAVTLDGLWLDCASNGIPAFAVAPGAAVSLSLSGTNTLLGGVNCAGVEVPDTASLAVSGDGALTAKGGENGAGIGGGYRGTGGSVSVLGGTVTATGGNYAAGIGGGGSGTGGTVSVSGGIVTATGGTSGAGIGSGHYGKGVSVSVSGGTVTAQGGNMGAGIGGGQYSTTNAVEITGGTVTAGGGNYGPGIGSGDQAATNTPTGDTVAISGGLVRVAAGNNAASLGCSECGNCGAIAISGGTVWERDGRTFLLGGRSGGTSSAESVAITGGSVAATSDNVLPAPSNGTARVWRVAVGGFEPDSEVPSFTGLPASYGTTDLYADASGNVYLWLPNGTYRFVVGDRPLRATVSNADTVAEEWLAGVTVNGTDVAFLSGDGWQFASDLVHLTDAGPFAISGTSSVIGIQADASCAVTLDSLSLAVTNVSKRAAFAIVPDASVELSLAGTNTLASGENAAGLQVIAGAAVAIDGEGSLTATGGLFGAGIGGARATNATAGSVTIAGGTVTAIGGRSSAGIGGGQQGNGGTVEITGGTVTATGGNNGAGIGGGFGDRTDSTSGGAISISDGTVTATGGGYAAGIGGGYFGDAGTIAISGGDVTANGDQMGAGIGGGQYGNGGTIEISGGRVTATSKSYAAAIGGGDGSGQYGGNAGAIRITGGTVVAKADGNGYGNGTANDIGDGYHSSTSGSLLIAGGSVHAARRGMGTPVPSNATDRVWCVTVTNLPPNSLVSSLSGFSGYGITDLYADASGNVYLWLPNGDYRLEINGGLWTATVEDGPVTAQCYNLGVTVNGTDVAFLSGDGWTYDADARQLSLTADCTLSGSNTEGRVQVVIAADLTLAASNLTLAATDRVASVTLSSHVSATLSLAGENSLLGGEDHPAVEVPVDSSLRIEGDGSLSATGGRNGAGIGSGWHGTGGAVAIAGGTVTATGGESGAGIGGGSEGSLDSIAISGGTVFPVAGLGASAVAAATNTFTGGSIAVEDAAVSPAPSNGTERVWCVTVPDFPPDAPVTNLVFAAPSVDYGTDGLRADADGNLYLWLPNGLYCLEIDGNPWYANVADGPDTAVTGDLLGVTVDGVDVVARQGPGWTFSTNGQLTLSADCTLSGSNGVGAVSVLVAADCTVTLSNLCLRCSDGYTTYAPVLLDTNVAATLVLAGDNTLRAVQPRAAIGVPPGTSLTVTGDGRLDAAGGYMGAGIGGWLTTGCGTVSIEGGILTLGRGTEAACIGGGSYGAGGDVAISGGTILLREYTSAPIPNSIGRGHSSTGTDGTLTITGGSLGELGSSRTRALDLSLLGSAPTNAAGEAVYSVTVTNLAPDAEAVFEGLPSWYGTNAIVADVGGNVYLWLPDGSYAFSAGTGEWMYAAEVAGAATVAVLVPPVYTVTWQNDDGTLLATNEVVADDLPVYEGETPAKPADAQFTYTFAGWDPEVVAATTDTVYTATYTATTNVYEIIWANDDGTALATNQVLYGETPVYEGEMPSKAETAQYSYAFAGWTPAPEAVTTNATYTATYTPSLRIYTVKFEDDDGTELSSADYPYGTAVADIAVPDAPEKAATAEFTYTFAGWDPEVAGVTTDAVYTATYAAVTNVYEITWIVDGAEERETYAYGAMPSHDDPVKDPDAEYFYAFSGWTPDVTNVTGQAAYTAVFDEIAKTGVSVDGVDAAAGSGEKWTYDSESAVLALTGGCVLSGSNTEGRVQVVVLADVALTASNLTLAATGEVAAVSVSSGVSASLVLAGENSLAGGAGHAAIEVPVGAALSIGGNGLLAAAGGGNAAAIGGAWQGTVGDIAVSGGTILPVAGSGASAIGSGADAQAGGTVTFTGGSIVAAADAVSPAPVNAGGEAVQPYVIEGLEPGEAVVVGEVPDYYGTEGIFADAEGKIVLWLPDGSDPEGEPAKKPNLAFRTPEGWPAQAFVATVAGSTSAVETVWTTNSLYLNFAYGNDGEKSAEAHAVAAAVKDADGNVVKEWTWEQTALEAGEGVAVEDQAFAVEAGGVYTVTVSLDPAGAVEESGADDNQAEFTFTAKAPQTVTFNGNGGTSATQSKVFAVGGKYSGLPTATWTGHAFQGWWTAASGGTQVTATNVVTAAGTRTLYAHWKVTSWQTVTFNANGGTCATKTKKYAVAEKYGTMPSATRSGQAMAGWFTAKSGGTKVTTASTVTTASKRTLYAHWTTKQTVKFDANGGTCATKTKTYAIGKTYGTLPSATMAGRGFVGWYTAKTGGTKVTAANTVTAVTPRTLYARWTTKQTVTFAPNGGTCAQKKKIYTIGQAYGTLPTATRSGQALLGWYTAKTGGTKVTAATKASTALSRTLYAHWTTKQTVKFNANGGTCATASKTYTVGKAYGSLPTATKAGSSFTGWFTAAEGGTKIATTNVATAAASRTLYAHWKAASRSSRGLIAGISVSEPEESPSPQRRGMARRNGGANLVLTVETEAGVEYELQWTPELGGEWATVLQWVATEEESEVELPVMPEDRMGFFRLLQPADSP